MLAFAGQDEHPIPLPALAYEYYEEARLCWYMGAFVATIIMVQISFEELLRSHYRVSKGVGGKLSNDKKVDDVGFNDLIDEAKNEGYISTQEAGSLHNLRKNIRNSFVHAKDVKISGSGNTNFKTPNFFTQTLKIQAPEVLGSDVVDEAKEAIKLLVIAFPDISKRHGGL